MNMNIKSEELKVINRAILIGKVLKQSELKIYSEIVSKGVDVDIRFVRFMNEDNMSLYYPYNSLFDKYKEWCKNNF